MDSTSTINRTATSQSIDKKFYDFQEINQREMPFPLAVRSPTKNQVKYLDHTPAYSLNHFIAPIIFAHLATCTSVF